VTGVQTCALPILSRGMKERSAKYGNFIVKVCSNEDIFLFKTMTEREVYVKDCIAIAQMQALNWEIILKELECQIESSQNDVWITWVGERMDIINQRGIDIPIINEINQLREEYYQKMKINNLD